LDVRVPFLLRERIRRRRRRRDKEEEKEEGSEVEEGGEGEGEERVDRSGGEPQMAIRIVHSSFSFPFSFLSFSFLFSFPLLLFFMLCVFECVVGFLDEGKERVEWSTFGTLIPISVSPRHFQPPPHDTHDTTPSNSLHLPFPPPSSPSPSPFPNSTSFFYLSTPPASSISFISPILTILLPLLLLFLLLLNHLSSNGLNFSF